ncbi:MAG: bestrophin family protein [Rubripirellula sp.]
MYTQAANPITTLWTVSRELWRHFIPIFLYVIVIELLDVRYHLENYNFPVPVVAVLGTVIGLILAFRTNSCYGRWWEARTLWGAIVNDSRSWTRQLIEFTSNVDLKTDATLRRMSHRQIAWCYALSRSLRTQDPTQDLAGILSIEEISQCKMTHHVPNDLLLRQAKELRSLYDMGHLELFQFVELEKTLTRLTDSMGGCERIKNTNFPSSYSRLVNTLIYLFVIFLPFGLVGVPAFGLITTSVSFAMAFLMIDRVSIFLQDPFSSRPSDTPMLSLSRTIEINIREMLGETELPEKMKPINGVLN